MTSRRIEVLLSSIGSICMIAMLATTSIAADGEPGESEESAGGSKPAEMQIREIVEPTEELDDGILTPEPYFYESLGRRDPFVSYVSPDYTETTSEDDPSSGQVQVVGILWAEHDRFALVETPEGRSMILREGSQLGDGTVIQIQPDRITVHVTQYGTSKTVTLPLLQGGSFHENRRTRSR